MISVLYFNTFFSAAADGAFSLPFVNSDNFAVERIFRGINDSTSMTFAGPNDILILEIASGKVDRIVNGQMPDRPLIDLNTHQNDGLIGIPTSRNTNGSVFVFLYFNEAPKTYGMDIDNLEEATMANWTSGYDREGDRLYRFEMIGDKLVDPKLVFGFPPTKPVRILDHMHHGGEVIIGSDNSIYLAIGDLDGRN